MNKNRLMMIGGGMAVAVLLLAVCAGLLYRNFGAHKRKPAAALTLPVSGLAPLPAPGSKTGQSDLASILPPAADVAPGAASTNAAAPVDASSVAPIAATPAKPLPAPAAAPAAAPDAVASSTPGGLTAPVITPVRSTVEEHLNSIGAENRVESVAPSPQTAVVPVAVENRSGRATVYDAIDQLNTDSALLNAQIAHEKLKKTLADLVAGRDPSAGPSQSAAFGRQPAMEGAIGAKAAAARGPSVAQVTTSPQVNGGAPTADVILPSGGHVAAKVGSRIPGAGVIESVSIHSVMVSDGKRAIALPFASDGDASVLGGH